MQRLSLLLCALSAVVSCTARHQVNEQCSFDNDCNEPLVCAAQYCRAACVTDRDCVGGYVCLPSGAPGLRVCLPPSQNVRCRLDTDCTGGLVCLPRGVCGRECLADIDCQVRNPFTRCETAAGRCFLPRDAGAGDVSTDAARDAVTDLSVTDDVTDVPATMRDGAADASDASGDGGMDVAVTDATTVDVPSRDAADATDAAAVADAAPTLPLPTVRRVFPSMGAVLTGLPGELRWLEPPGSAGAITSIEIQVCDDPACATVTHRFAPPPLNSATATAGAPGRVAFTTPPLSARTHYWRMRTVERGVTSAFTAPWRFSVRRGIAAIHTLSVLQGRTHDLNLDGFADAVLGAPGQQTVRAVFGEPTWVLPRTAAVTATSIGLGSVVNFGARLRFAGDANNDGLEDVLVAGDPERVTMLGTVASGATSTFAGLATTAPGAAGVGSRFGRSFASAGDLNADGYDDVVVGVPNDAMNPGYRVFLGPLVTPSGFTTAQPTAVGVMGQGTIVAPVGDMNGDGFPDVMIGATVPAEIPVGFIHGGTSDPTYAQQFPPRPKGSNAEYGASIAGVGDFNGDGYPDAVVGNTGLASGGPAQVFLLVGSVDGPLDGGPLPTVAGAPSDLGAAVIGAGDLNADGFSDVIASNATGSFIAVYFGAMSPARPLALAVTTPLTAGTVVLAGGDDYNNDGRSEVLIGSSAGGGVIALRMVPGMDRPVLTPMRLDTEASLGAAIASREARHTRRLCMLEGNGG